MSSEKTLVFVSYRREDHSWASDLFAEKLSAVLGPDSLFYDTRSINPGADFRSTIVDALEKAAVLVVAIGPNWLGASEGSAQRKIDKPDDWVHFEIAKALELGIPLLPIVLEPAAMPTPEDLPIPIRKLAYTQAVTLYRGADFDLGFERFVGALAESLPPAMSTGIPLATPSTTPVANRLGRRFIWLVLACLLLLVGLAILLTRRDDGPPSFDGLDVASKSYASSVEGWILELHGKLQSAASHPALRANEGAAHQPVLDELAADESFPGGVYTLDNRGVIVAQATPNYPKMDDLRGMDFSHREYFIQCQKRMVPIVTNAFLSANRNEQIVVVAAPRTSHSGLFAGIIDGVIDVDSSRLSAVAQDTAEASAEPLRVHLVDGLGMVIASNVQTALRKPYGRVDAFRRFQEKRAQGIGNRVAFTRVRSTPFVVAVEAVNSIE